MAFFGIGILALVCTSSLLVPIAYTYYDWNPSTNLEKVGLGISSVFVGQLSTILYFYMYKYNYLFSQCPPLLHDSTKLLSNYDFCQKVWNHLLQPEGFFLLGSYLFFTYYYNYLPDSYYKTTENIEPMKVVGLLCLQDALQYGMHRFQHKTYTWLYQISHKPHHKHRTPILFNAFDGSILDTSIMIIIPLYVSCVMIHANVWTYMTFGTMYANMLVWIHSEYVHPWESLFAIVGIGTSKDHRYHHQYYNCNYGHLFMYWDKLCGTHRTRDMHS